ncbi:MAG: Dabb family protein [Clostridia bacterium]|nr:Dabb family protein [Clostridia bacterium]
MIRHIVMWKIKEEAESMNKPEIMAHIKDILLALKGKIPVVRDLEVGESLTNGDMHYDMALIVTVDKLDDLPLYANHPEHLKVRDFISKVRLDRVTADIEV